MRNGMRTANSISVSIRASLQQRGELIESLPSVLIEVSIRASLQQRGEPVGPAAIISPVAFQSAPHFSSEANARRSGARAPTKEFQSAPHFSSEANDVLYFAAAVSFSVSIRASLQQRGERLPSPLLSFEREVSIRASLQQRGEPAHYPIQVPWYSSFNPRLTSAARRTSVARMGETNQKEFQSAPHFSSEANRVRGNVVK